MDVLSAVREGIITCYKYLILYYNSKVQESKRPKMNKSTIAVITDWRMIPGSWCEYNRTRIAWKTPGMFPGKPKTLDKSILPSTTLSIVLGCVCVFLSHVYYCYLAFHWKWIELDFREGQWRRGNSFTRFIEKTLFIFGVNYIALIFVKHLYCS